MYIAEGSGRPECRYWWSLADPADRFGGPSFGGGGLTYHIFKFIHGFRPLYFEIAEF